MDKPGIIPIREVERFDDEMLTLITAGDNSTFDGCQKNSCLSNKGKCTVNDCKTNDYNCVENNCNLNAVYTPTPKT